jgi:hypothetical protein
MAAGKVDLALLRRRLEQAGLMTNPKLKRVLESLSGKPGRRPDPGLPTLRVAEAMLAAFYKARRKTIGDIRKHTGKSRSHIYGVIQEHPPKKKVDIAAEFIPTLTEMLEKATGDGAQFASPEDRAMVAETALMFIDQIIKTRARNWRDLFAAMGLEIIQVRKTESK